MLELLDPVLLARIQFAFTISFHILFPAFTIGLASFLVVLEVLKMVTGQKIYMEIYDLWVKVFALSFGMGVVSGIVLSYEFGTNWSEFSYKAGNIIGPLMGYEVLTAFFLEASFLGIMLFGRGRVSAKMHFAATCIVAIGTLISAFWILSVNSWMQTPAGYSIEPDGRLMPENWLQIIFNPSFVYRYIHMVMACYLSTAFIVGGAAAWYLLHKKFMPQAKIMLVMSLLMALFVAPLQILIGDLHGLGTLKHQPMKIAAIEGIWENETSAPFRLFAIPDSEKETNKYSIEIPYLSSLILTHSLTGEVKGLKNWPKEDRPPVVIPFFSFRIMVGLGFAMALTGILALILFLKNKLFTTRWFLRWCHLMAPAGFIALLCGWFVTETGRQPYVVYGLLKTKDLASPILVEQLLFSLAAFVIVYLFVFSMGVYYMFRLVRNGPKFKDGMDVYGQHATYNPLTLAEIFYLKKK